MQEDLEKIVKDFRKYKKFWNLKDVAEFLELSPRTVWNMIKTGELEAIKVGKEWRVHYTTIIKYLKSHHNYNIE